MIKNHLLYLSKFGSQRIKKYVRFLLDKFEFTDIEKENISVLSEYYKLQDDPRMDQLIKTLTTHNLWYTLYL